MRILHVIPYMQSHFGGPPQVVKAMVEVTAEQGHTLEVFTTTAGSNQTDPLLDQRQESEFLICRMFPLSFPEFWFSSKKIS